MLREPQHETAPSSPSTASFEMMAAARGVPRCERHGGLGFSAPGQSRHGYEGGCRGFFLRSSWRSGRQSFMNRWTR